MRDNEALIPAISIPLASLPALPAPPSDKHPAASYLPSLRRALREARRLGQISARSAPHLHQWAA